MRAGCHDSFVRNAGPPAAATSIATTTSGIPPGKALPDLVVLTLVRGLFSMGDERAIRDKPRLSVPGRAVVR